MEQALIELLSAHTSLAVAVSDAEGTLSLMTPALEKLLGDASTPVREDDIPQRFNLLCEDGATPLAREDVPIVRARAGETVIDAVVAARPDRDDDQVVYLRCNAGPLREADGSIRGAVVLVQDITQDWQARRRETLLRERMTTTLDHELRTPVTKLRTNLEALMELRDDLPDWAVHSLDAIAGASRDLSALSRTITPLVELQAAWDVTPTGGDLAPVLRSLPSDLAEVLERRDLALEVDVPDRLPCVCDRTAVRRAITELVTNAATYAPTGSTVHVTGEVDGPDLVVAVSDSGPGVAADVRERLLEPFERGDLPEQPDHARGLGLAYARIIANAHGGDLHLEDNEPQGLRAVWRVNRHGERGRLSVRRLTAR